MRIALITDTYAPQINGVTTVLRRIARALADAGHEAAVVAPAYPGHDPDEGWGRELRIASLPFPPYPAIRLCPPATHRIAPFLDDVRPHVVHVATEGPLGLQGRRYALDRRLPLVTSYHTHFPRYTAHYGVSALEPAVWRFISWFHRPARLTHTPGEHARRELQAHGIGHAIVWGQGVDTRAFHHAKRDGLVRHRLGIGDDQVAVLHVGRLAAEKDLGTLVASWQRAHAALGPAARFVVAGDGPMSEQVAAGLPFAARLGFLPADQLAALYASCDLCVLPSPTETCGLVALEAMASGLPVIAADCGGLAESVEHGTTGLRVPPGDVAGFAGAIGALVQDRGRRLRMASQARVAAVARDSAIEDAELLDQYAHVAGLETERDAWRAAS